MTEAMREEWDDRGEENAKYYISSFKDDWTKEEFYHWGEIQVNNIVKPYLRKHDLEYNNYSILEIGCGVGRMTKQFSELFDHVYAYDVSEVMIEKAREENRNLDNVDFDVGDGSQFPEIPDDSIDFVFSGWVFQHMPNEEVVRQNISEVARVLKPGGKCQLHMSIEDGSSVRAIALRQLPPELKSFLSNYSIFEEWTPTWSGVSFKTEEVLKIFVENGLKTHTNKYVYYNPFTETTEEVPFFIGEATF